MGNDGGSIPKRRELVKNASRAPTVSELKATALESLTHAWTHCFLSGAALDMEAVVSDWRGHLYNYEAILKGLMSSGDSAEADLASLAITSLRDVVRLTFSKRGDNWICPISMKEMGPATRAVYLVPCGHAFAEQAMTEIQESSCPECSQQFDRHNVIPILSTSESDTQKLEARIESLRTSGLSHSLKKDKSAKKKKRKGDEPVEANADSKDFEPASQAPQSRLSKDVESRMSGINNPMAASLTAKVMAEQQERTKRRKLISEEHLRHKEVVKS